MPAPAEVFTPDICILANSNGSIEFKHQNISAVLEKLGMPWIPGYKPRRNYQGAILDAIDRYLSNHPQALEIVPTAKTLVGDASEIFVNAPEMTRDVAAPEPLRRLLTKFDPVERDHLNRSLGKAGEAFVLDIERKRLSEAARRESESRQYTGQDARKDGENNTGARGG
jgi:hypothetical protein